MALKALIINCTLKKTAETSNTGALINKAVTEFKELGVETEVLRFLDYTVKHGTTSDEGDGDQWPLLLKKIQDSDIFIIASPVWVGHTSSTAQQIIERLDAMLHDEKMTNPENGQYMSYNKVAGVLVTGNEDGAHSVVAQLSWALAELGFTVPPNSNAYWVGMAGPGPSYIEAGGERYLYTNELVLYMVHNITYFANLLKNNPITTNLNELNKKAELVSDKQE